MGATSVGSYSSDDLDPDQGSCDESVGEENTHDDPQYAAGAVDLVEASSSEMGESSKGVAACLSWPKLEVISNDGRKRYPFLENPSPRDVALLKQIQMHTPFVQNRVAQAWNLLVQDLVKEVDSNGVLLFPPNFGYRAAQKRGLEMIKKMTEIESSAPWRSGTDDEIHSDFVDLLSGLAEMYNSHESSKAAQKDDRKLQAAAKSRKDEVAMAEVIRAASLRNLANRKSSESASALSNATPASRRSSIDTAQLHSVISGSVDRMEDRRGIKRLKIETKREIEKERFLLEKEKFEHQKAQDALEKAQDALDRELQREISRKQMDLMTNLLELVKKNNNS